MGKVSRFDVEMGHEETVELSFGAFADVKHQKLFGGMGLEISHYLRVVFIPVVQPALFQLPTAADTLGG